MAGPKLIKFSQPFCKQGSVFSVCGMFVGGKDNGDCLLFYWRLMLLWVIGVEFENTCVVLGN